MNFEEFASVFDAVKSAKPLWLEGEMEPVATDDQISEVESELDLKLPKQYIEFIRNIGSGYFGFTNIFSVNPEGDWYLPEMMRQFDLPGNFIPITDDETGGYYGFMMQDNVCGESVYYYHFGDSDKPVFKYQYFFDYLVEVGLKK